MVNYTFRYSSPYIDEVICDSFIGNSREKQVLRQITLEWNSRLWYN